VGDLPHTFDIGMQSFAENRSYRDIPLSEIFKIGREKLGTRIVLDERSSTREK
jgi:hypothetical protein